MTGVNCVPLSRLFGTITVSKSLLRAKLNLTESPATNAFPWAPPVLKKICRHWKLDTLFKGVQFGFPIPVLPFRRTWLMMFTPPVPPHWVAGVLPLKLSPLILARPIMMELKESPFSPVPGAASTSKTATLGSHELLLLVVGAPATAAWATAACVPPPAVAVAARVLLIKGLSDNALT